MKRVYIFSFLISFDVYLVTSCCLTNPSRQQNSVSVPNWTYRPYSEIRQRYWFSQQSVRLR